MIVSEVLQYLKQNPGMSLKQVANNLGMTYRSLEAIAKLGGIDIRGRINKKEVCKDAPLSCFDCPFSDCKNLGKSTKSEQEYLQNAFDGYHYGNNKKRGRKSKNDKQKNQGKQGSD